MAGCAPEPVKTAPAPMAPVIMFATPEQISEIRASITKVNPNARVGQVGAVSASVSMAAVSGIILSELPPNASIQFLDSHGMGIANGTVRPATDSSQIVIVDYSPTPTGRAPVAGDLAVYIPR